MLPLQDLSDRIEINDLIARYAHAVDERNWDAMDALFTADAVIDYSELGGSSGSVAHTKAFLAEAMPRFSAFQHLSATSKIDLDGDKASAKTILFNPMVMDHEGKKQVFFIGLWYEDKLVRTPDGWRIAHRREKKCWDYNAPEGMLPD